MVKISVKPLSLNEAYRGRRFKTKELSLYKQAIRLLAPKLPQIEGKLEAHYRFGMSSKGSDVDNCIKCLQDALAECYGFNDNRIYKMVVEKVDCKKGEEFVEFEIKALE
jgi:Holliday junction resolvase RusA-like endonuclease